MSSDKIKKIVTISIVLLVIIPLMRYGYMIWLDFVSDTWWTLPTSTFHTFFIYNFPNRIFHTLGIPSWVLEKIFIILIYWLIWFYGYKSIKTWNIYADIFGISLLVLNPFIYGRFLDGQINVVLMYVFMITFLYHTLQYIDHKQKKDLIWIWVRSLALMLTSAHSIFMIIWSQIIIWISYISQKSLDIKQIWLSIFKTVSVLIVFNLVWIIPLITTNNRTAKFVNEQIDGSHIKAFVTRGGDVWLYANTLAMRGYRWEEQYRFVSHQPITIVRHMIFIVMMILVLIGVINSFRLSSYRSRDIRYKTWSMLGIFAMAYVLWLGVAGNNIFAHISQWLYDYVLFYIWLREPHKWILFLPIVYVYFGGIWVRDIINWFERRYNDKDLIRYVGIFFSIIPILYMPKMLWWFAWQIDITDYPKPRYELRSKFLQSGVDADCRDIMKLERNIDGKCYNLLILPRHGYMKQTWTQKVVPWPLASFISRYALISDNVEMREFYNQSSSYESKIIEDGLGIIDYPDIDITTGSLLDHIKGMGIYHIILMKSSNHDTYIPKLAIYEDNLEVVFEDDTLTWYQIKK